jgi:hypothetical protein
MLTIGNSKRNLQKFHDDASAMDWSTPVAGSLMFLEHLDLPPAESPVILVLCADPPRSAALLELARTMRLDPGRITAVVTPEILATTPLPRGIRVICCDRDNPEQLFSTLSL